MKILITGTPCTGKTTLGQLLANALGYERYTLLDIVKDHDLIEFYDEERDEYEIDYEKVEKFLEKFLENKDNVIIEATDPTPIPNKIDLAIVLRCDPDILAIRMKKRSYPEDKIFRNLQAEVSDYCLLKSLEKFGKEKVHEIYTKNKKPEEILKEAIKVIKGEIKPKIHEELPFHKDLYKYF